MGIEQFLTGLLSGALTVPAVSWLLNNLPVGLNKGQKRYVAVGASFLLGLTAFGLSVYLGYTPMPESDQALAEAIWPILMTSYTASQVVLAGVKSDTVQKIQQVFKKEELNG